MRRAASRSFGGQRRERIDPVAVFLEQRQAVVALAAAHVVVAVHQPVGHPGFHDPDPGRHGHQPDIAGGRLEEQRPSRPGEGDGGLVHPPALHADFIVLGAVGGTSAIAAPASRRRASTLRARVTETQSAAEEESPAPIGTALAMAIRAPGGAASSATSTRMTPVM